MVTPVLTVTSPPGGIHCYIRPLPPTEMEVTAHCQLGSYGMSLQLHISSSYRIRGSRAKINRDDFALLALDLISPNHCLVLLQWFMDKYVYSAASDTAIVSQLDPDGLRHVTQHALGKFSM